MANRKIIPGAEIAADENVKKTLPATEDPKFNLKDLADVPDNEIISIPLKREDGSGIDDVELKLTFKSVALTQHELKITFPGILQGVGGMDFEVINTVIWACVLHTFPKDAALPTVDEIADRIPLDEFDNVSNKVEKLLRKAFPKLFTEIDAENASRKNLIRQLQEENLRKTLGIGDILKD
jgi:hypothetical protein